jgi:hypothetical protein
MGRYQANKSSCNGGHDLPEILHVTSMERTCTNTMAQNYKEYNGKPPPHVTVRIGTGEGRVETHYTVTATSL